MSSASRRKTPPKQFAQIAIDRCPSCATHFKKGKVIIIWHDVAECTYCGCVWILVDLREYKRWT